MEISIRNVAIAVVVVAASSFMVGRYSTPSKVVTKSETQTKTTENDDKVVTDNDNKDVTIDETVNKDGSINRKIHIVDKGVTVTTDNKQIQTATDTKTETIKTNLNADWNISLLATPSHLDDVMLGTGSMGYGVHLQRRVLGPFSIGVFGITNKTYGFSIGGTF